MKICSNYIFAIVLLALAGCIQKPIYVQPPAIPAAKPETIIVNMQGPVQITGRQYLQQPFTVAHAIENAGGLIGAEEQWNKDVNVVHRDRQQAWVGRTNYHSFKLANEDTLRIPRH